jgi:predicted permease
MSGGNEYVFSYPAFREMQRHPKPDLAEVAGFRYLDGTLAYKNNAANARVLAVSGEYFSVLRVRPIFGRTLIPADDQGAGNPVAVLGYNYWKNHLGGQAGVLNQPINLYGCMFTIVGVAPKGFNGTTVSTPPDVIIPLASFVSIPTAPMGPLRNMDTHSWIYQVARIKSGATREQAAAHYSPICAAIAKEVRLANNSFFSSGPSGPSQDQGQRQVSVKFVDGSRGYSTLQKSGKAPLLILMIATGLVLAIAMANAANLLLARSAARRRELAICAAIGANKEKIIGQLLSEAMVLAAAGGIAGIAFSWLTLNFLRFLLDQLVLAAPIPLSLDVTPTQLEWPVLIYGLGLALLTGLLFGLYPAWEAARVAPIKILNQESGHSSQTAGAARVRKALVCVQVMLSAILLIPTGLCMKSLVTLMRVDLGIRTENQVVFSLSPTLSGYSIDRSQPLYDQAEQSLAAIPGVISVTSAMNPLIGNSNNETLVEVEGFAKERQPSSCWNEIGPNFFGQMGIPLLSGREFTLGDNQGGPKVAIVNEQFADFFFRGQNPIGRKLKALSGIVAADREIVGVVKNSHYASVRQAPPKIFYLPWRQNEGNGMLGSMTFYLRTKLPAAQIIAQVRKTMQGVDPNLPLQGLQTMEDQVSRNITPDRLIFQLSGILAALATILAVTGLYGVMAYSVVRRKREIGIRIAIGANPSGIWRIVIREMLAILAVGLVLGIPAALGIAKALESTLFGVKSYDPFVVIGVSVILGLAALIATSLPAWRASRIDPLNTLRAE